MRRRYVELKSNIARNKLKKSKAIECCFFLAVPVSNDLKSMRVWINQKEFSNFKSNDEDSDLVDPISKLRPCRRLGSYSKAPRIRKLCRI